MKLILMADGIVGENIAIFLMKIYPNDLLLIVTTQINNIYNEAVKNRIPVCVFDSEEGVLSKINKAADLGVMAWWPKILRGSLLDAPRLGFINTHPSLLPYNRGKHYNFWAIVEQVPFGVTLHCVDSGIDTGNIVTQSTIDYDWCDTGETLYRKAQKAIVKLFCETYPDLRVGQFETRPQDKFSGSFHLSSELELASQINLDAFYRARDLLNLLRARMFEGYPGCWFEIDDAKYEVSIKIRKVN